MHEADLGSWEAFEEQLRSLEKEREDFRRATGQPVSNLLFRGHSESTWRLETTLERYAPDLKAVDYYYHLIYFARYEIESLSGLTWNLMHPRDYLQWLQSEDAFGPLALPSQDYMLYCRHHGFPSPLLDWSRSPYVAAFFAFRDTTSRAAAVSIYAFVDNMSHAEAPDAPRVTHISPYAPGHRRHFIQQCEYTLCRKFRAMPPPAVSGRNKLWEYACHEGVVGTTAPSQGAQDLLWKFTIPVSERLKVLRILDRYNVNAHSLFGSEESLMETMAIRKLLLEPEEVRRSFREIDAARKRLAE